MENYYEILRISSLAGPDDIKSTIRKMRKRYRQLTGTPDKKQALNAEAMMEKLKEAEEILLDTQKRAAYDEKLNHQPVPIPTSGPAPTLVPADAEAWIQKSRAYMSNNQMSKAAQAAMEATLLEPSNPEAWIARIEASSLNNNLDDVVFCYQHAQRSAMRSGRVFGSVALAFEAENQFENAKIAYETAARVEPDELLWKGAVIEASLPIADELPLEQRRQELARLLVQAQGFFEQNSDNEIAKRVYGEAILYEAGAAIGNKKYEGQFTSNKQVAYVRQQLEEVKNLNSVEPELRDLCQYLSDFLEDSTKREFNVRGIVGSLVVLLPLFLFSLIFFGDSFPGTVFALILWGFIGWTAYQNMFPIKWKRDLREVKVARTAVKTLNFLEA